jgi:hypothetical protein
MSSGSATDALIEESLGALLRAASDALAQSAQRDGESARDTMAAQASQAQSALKEACADPRKMSARVIQALMQELADDAVRIVARLGEARQQQEQDIMAALVKDAVRGVQASMDSVKEDLLEKQRKQTGDAVRKLKAAALRQQQATENAAVAEAAQKFREKEAALTKRVHELTEQVEALTARAESAEGVVERSLSAADNKTTAMKREVETLRCQLVALEERHRSERAIRTNLQKTTEQRGAEFWRMQPSNSQIKPNRSVLEMRREEQELRERVRLAEAYTEKRRKEALEESERRRKQEAEHAELERKLKEEQDRTQREEHDAAAAEAAEREAQRANQRPPLVERQGNTESQQRAHGEASDHESSALRKEQRALEHDRQQQSARRPLSPTKVSPRRSDGTEGWQSPPRATYPQRTPQTSPRRRRVAGGGHAAVAALRESSTVTLDSVVDASRQMLGTSHIGSPAYGSGVFERSVAELSYSASVAEIFGDGSHAGYNPNSGAVSALRQRPHSAAAGLPGGYTAVNGTPVVATSGLPLHVQQGQQMPPPPPPPPASLSSISASSIGISSSFHGIPQSQSHLDLHVAGTGRRGPVRDGGLDRRGRKETAASGRARRGSADGRRGGKHSSLAVQRADAMLRYNRDVLPSR